MQNEQKQEQRVTLSPHVIKLLGNYCHKTGMHLDQAMEHLLEQEAARPFVMHKLNIEVKHGG